MTLNSQWSWRPNDQVKTLKQCIDVLVTCAGRNGNLALDTGPMPDGQIEPRQVVRFREIGDWLKKYGRSIYATRGGPFWGLHCATTRKENTIYLHILKWYGDKVLLPPIPRKIVAHSLLTGGTATVRQAADQVEVFVPREHRCDLDTIVELQLDGPAGDLKPAQIVSDSLCFGKKVTASSVYPGPVGRQYLPAFAVDGDDESGWTFAANLKSAWLEVDLGKPCTFDTAEIHERYDRIRGFRIQVKQRDQWVTICQGARIGEHFSTTFAPVTAQFVRLEVLDTTINPLVAEFHVFRSK
jgi:alpha-L-fucosidase